MCLCLMADLFIYFLSFLLFQGPVIQQTERRVVQSSNYSCRNLNLTSTLIKLRLTFSIATPYHSLSAVKGLLGITNYLFFNHPSNTHRPFWRDLTVPTLLPWIIGHLQHEKSLAGTKHALTNCVDSYQVCQIWAQWWGWDRGRHRLDWTLATI